MDGSEMTKIVTEDVFWPNCITIDYTSDRLFWVDAQTVRLEYVIVVIALFLNCTFKIYSSKACT